MAEAKRPGSTARRSRRHGYRGYGSGFDRGTEGYGGAIHWGRGFAGVGTPGVYSSDALPRIGPFGPEEASSGPYRGVAPKGYTRSDDRIRDDICDELTRHPDVDPSRLTVTVQKGEVTLEGSVDALWTRRLVDGIATGSVGVRQVHNRLRVEPGESS